MSTGEWWRCRRRRRWGGLTRVRLVGLFVVSTLALGLSGALAPLIILSQVFGGAIAVVLFAIFVLAALLALVFAVSSAADVVNLSRRRRLPSAVATLYPGLRLYPSEAAMLDAHPLTPAPEPVQQCTETKPPALASTSGEPEPGSPEFWKFDL